MAAADSDVELDDDALIPLSTLFLDFANLDKLFLEDLRNPLQVSDVCRVCTTVRDQLSKARTQFLFPQVIPHLANYLEPTDLKNCRLVCYPWKNGTDIFLQQDPLWTPTFQQFPSGKPQRQIVTSFANPDQITNFITQFSTEGSFPPNPFPSRTLLFSNMGQRNFVKACGNLLDAFGNQVWHCIYTHQVKDIFQMRRIVGILQETIFLTSLTVNGIGDPFTCEPLRGRRPLTFPKLDHLKSLRLMSYDHAWEPTGECSIFQLWDGLLQAYGKQLESFESTGEVFHTNYLKFPGFDEILPRLRELKLFHVDAVQLAQKLRLMHSPLESVSLEFRHPLRVSFLNLIQVFSRYSSTLVDLHFGFEEQQVASTSASFHKNICSFPKLRHLGIPFCYLDSPPMSKVFEKLPALTEITLYWQVFHRATIPASIEIHKMLVETQLWTRIPKLWSASVSARDSHGNRKFYTFGERLLLPQEPRTRPSICPKLRWSTETKAIVIFLVFGFFFIYGVQHIFEKRDEIMNENCTAVLAHYEKNCKG